MWKKISDKLVFIYLALLLLIIIGFIYIGYQVHHAQPITYHQAASSSASSGELGAEMTISKGWLESFAVRANQYDATVYNNTKYPVVDWELSFEIPSDGLINDSWSCEYSVDDYGSVRVKGLDYNYDIAPGESVTFGFILFSGQQLI